MIHIFIHFHFQRKKKSFKIHDPHANRIENHNEFFSPFRICIYCIISVACERKLRYQLPSIEEQYQPLFPPSIYLSVYWNGMTYKVRWKVGVLCLHGTRDKTCKSHFVVNSSHQTSPILEWEALPVGMASGRLSTKRIKRSPIRLWLVQEK